MTVTLALTLTPYPNPRPFYRGAQDIGTWFQILQGIVVIGVTLSLTLTLTQTPALAPKPRPKPTAMFSSFIEPTTFSSSLNSKRKLKPKLYP